MALVKNVFLVVICAACLAGAWWTLREKAIAVLNATDESQYGDATAPCPWSSPQGDCALRLERLRLVDEWLGSRGALPPPAHWRVRSPNDVDASRATVLRANHGQKSVNATFLVRPAGAGKDEPAVLKEVRHGHRGHWHDFEFGRRASDIAYFELLYLEYLRGEPGVPELYGGWAGHNVTTWVTSKNGLPIAKGTGFFDERKNSSIAIGSFYDALAERRPLDLARSWFRCFRSFAERGGFVLTDFKPEQFTIDAVGTIRLVDGPAPNSGPVADFARRRHFLEGHPTKIIVPGTDARPLPNHIDLEPGAPGIYCEHDQAANRTALGGTRNKHCNRRTDRHHSCLGKNLEVCCADGSTAAPELSECGRDGRCAPFDGRVHVFDAAARSWILPRIIDRAADRTAAARLANLTTAMLAPDPRDRPTFDALLFALAVDQTAD